MVAYVQARAIWLSIIRHGNWANGAWVASERMAFNNMQRAFAVVLNDAFPASVGR